MNKDEALRLALEALEADEYEMVDDGSGHMVFVKDKAIAAIKQVMEQPEPEPVKVIGFDCVCGRRLMVESSNGVVASPPKREWQGLTDEEKGWCVAPTMRETIERVEAKLKEKNNA